MIIPWESLEPDTLDAIIESFILREGTDYGLQEVALSHKIYDVKTQLMEEVIVIVWSQLHGSVNIMTKSDFYSKPVE